MGASLQGESALSHNTHTYRARNEANIKRDSGRAGIHREKAGRLILFLGQNVLKCNVVVVLLLENKRKNCRFTFNKCLYGINLKV